MNSLIEQAKQVLKECKEVAQSSHGNYVGEAISIRNITEEFISKLPKEIIEVIDRHNLAVKYLDEMD